MFDVDAYIRPSALAQLDLCPGAARMQALTVEKIGEPQTEQQATTGTTGHRFGALGLRLLTRGGVLHDLDEVCEDIAGRMERFNVDEWTGRCVERYVRFIHGLILSNSIKPEHVLVEVSRSMEDLGMYREGTADVILVVPYVRVIVIDLKLGYDDAGDADDHAQAHAYAMQAAQDYQCEEAVAWIYQPRAEKERRATGARFDAETLRQNAVWTRQVCDAARDPSAPLRPRFEACRYCKARFNCKTAWEYIMAAKDRLEMIGDPENADEWGDLADAAKLAGAFAKAAEGMVKGHLKDGGEATGFCLKSSGTMTKIDTAHAITLAEDDPDRCGALLRHATIKAGAAKELEWIAPAVSKVEKSPSLMRDKKGKK